MCAARQRHDSDDHDDASDLEAGEMNSIGHDVDLSEIPSANRLPNTGPVVHNFEITFHQTVAQCKQGLIARFCRALNPAHYELLIKKSFDKEDVVMDDAMPVEHYKSSLIASSKVILQARGATAAKEESGEMTEAVKKHPRA